MTNNDKEPFLSRNEYLAERRRLNEIEVESSEDFDKTVLTLGTGAIALSVAFIDKIEISSYQCLLLSSWLIFLASIIFVLASFAVSKHAMRYESKLLNEQYKEQREGAENKFAGWPTRFSYISAGLFLLGSILFLIFVFLNLDNLH